MSARAIVVAGAGIGGLAAALAASRTGYHVTVLERAIELEEAGAGVQLAANATRCLAFLGVFEHLRGTAVRPEAFQIIDGKSGRRLNEARMGRDAQARFGAPFLVVHRADLQAALLAAVREDPNIELQLGRTMEEFAVHHGTVTVLANRGGDTEEYRARALIGADGIRSTVRNRLGGAAPVFRHRAAWRATVPTEALPARFAEPVVRLYLGADAHIVAYPVRGGDAVNLVVVTADQRPSHGWGIGATADDLAAPFAKWSREARILIAAPERWLRWALFDLDPATKPWGTGPVTLLGDAAHAMLPFLAQGAAQALEDACVLGVTLAEAKDDDMPAALRVYEQRRIGRVTRVQNAARTMDRIYHLGGAARLARDLIIRTRSGDSMLDRYGWIYQWGP